LNTERIRNVRPTPAQLYGEKPGTQLNTLLQQFCYTPSVTNSVQTCFLHTPPRPRRLCVTSTREARSKCPPTAHANCEKPPPTRPNAARPTPHTVARSPAVKAKQQSQLARDSSRANAPTRPKRARARSISSRPCETRNSHPAPSLQGKQRTSAGTRLADRSSKPRAGGPFASLPAM